LATTRSEVKSVRIVHTAFLTDVEHSKQLPPPFKGAAVLMHRVGKFNEAAVFEPASPGRLNLRRLTDQGTAFGKPVL
jgi:hypothetical protein